MNNQNNLNSNHIKFSLLANFVSKGWSAVMGFAFIPLYIRFMGIESFGLVGFFTVLQAVFTILDLGLTTTLNRELARYSAVPGKAQEMRDLVRTLEIIYWILAVIIGTLVIVFAPLIARHWVHAETLPINVVQNSIMMMGFVMAFQWPLGFYSGGLLGLQKQVLSSILNASWYTLRFAGAALVLLLISPTIQTFFAWQVFASALSTIAAAAALWINLPAGNRTPRFQKEIIGSVWHFAAGLSAISVTVLILHEADKVLVSKLVTLDIFGYYSLAWVVAGSLMLFIIPIFTVIFPVFSQKVAQGDIVGLTRLYHCSCQLMSVVVLPVAAVIMFFSSEILLLWTRNSVTVENTHVLVSFLIVGTAFNGLMYLPYGLQLAYGWTRLALIVNTTAVIILIPFLVLMTVNYGVVGAASVWVILNSGYLLFTIQFMHRRLLPDEKWRWYVNDVGLPMIAAVGTAVVCRLLLTTSAMSYWMLLTSIIVILCLAGVAAIIAASHIRQWIWNKLLKWRIAYGV